jgi:hypothetical protein
VREDYIEVAERLVMFLQAYPQGSLQGSWGWLDDNHTVIVYQALAYRDPEDKRPGIGTASEPYPGQTNFTRGSEIMNAETSAWGRAICALGIAANRGVASAQDVRASRARSADSVAPPSTPTIERTQGPVLDDPWQSGPPAEYSGPPADSGAYASAKQIGLIRGKCKAAGFESEEQQLQLVNTCLDLANLPHVEAIARLDKRAASKVIEAILNSVTV